MENIGAIVGGVVAFLGTVGPGIAWIVRRRDGKKDPIPKESAAVALAQSGVSLMQGVADRLGAELVEVRTELSDLRSELSDVRGEVSRLTTTLGAAARYIERLLRWAKSESRPPIPPLPSELRDLIDPALHD